MQNSACLASLSPRNRPDREKTASAPPLFSAVYVVVADAYNYTTLVYLEFPRQVRKNGGSMSEVVCVSSMHKVSGSNDCINRATALFCGVAYFSSTDQEVGYKYIPAARRKWT